MSSEFQSFDEYWSLFLLRSRSVALGRAGLGRTSVGFARVALRTLATRRTRRPVELRWAVAATLLACGKLLAGKLERELAEAVRAEGEGLPPLAALGEPEQRRAAPPSPAWAVWM
ncbi:MAG: hypothetical protein IPM35_17310 [Myxococcales bacterium]|nr:hypothetical protein [Myxococcales bacterium]